MIFGFAAGRFSPTPAYPVGRTVEKLKQGDVIGMNGKRKTEFIPNPSPYCARINPLSRRFFLFMLVGGERDEPFVTPSHSPGEIVGRKDFASLTFPLWLSTRETRHGVRFWRQRSFGKVALAVLRNPQLRPERSDRWFQRVP